MLLNMYLCEKRERSQHGRLSQHHGLRKGHVDAFFRNTIKLFNSATLSQADCFTLITQLFYSTRCCCAVFLYHSAAAAVSGAGWEEELEH